ncbi:MAG: hypothetical protein A2Y88_04660 [Chloroflexi bacterium RBG_13_48_10]|nr:MAG: hypothetical protein A2Y88_04660 [Chloroflexi bacterium RBG_13_48_10]
MNTTVSNQNVVTIKEQGYKEQYQAKVNEYMAKQPSIVRGLHDVLQGLFLICLVIACIMFVAALYYTFVWAFTGALTRFGNAWIDFGLSMSFLAFPLGLDTMLTRIFPSVIFPASLYRSTKPIPFSTGLGYIVGGLGITCAGAPGAVHIFNLASLAIQKLF